jgi:protein TonB
MSKVSICETSWINLVFENRNKEYGAYQLRHESSRTIVMSFLSGILLIATLAGIYSISNLFEKPTIETIKPLVDIPIVVTNYSIPIEKKITPKTKPQAIKQPEPKVFAPMVVSKTPDVILDIPINKDLIENYATPQGTEGGTGVTYASGSENGFLAPDNGNAIVNAIALDKLPEFPGGMAKFYTYVGNNFEKPEIEGVNTIRVLVSFVIEKDGSMTDIQVKKDPGYGLGKEAIRVLKSLRTKWAPGMLGSKAVRTAYNLPITIQID